MGRSELSIRMEGGLERLLALGDRYAQAADALGALDLAEAAILRSRVDALLSEEPAHQQLWAQVERLQRLVTPVHHRQLEAVRSSRVVLERALTRLAPPPGDGELATHWGQIGPRLHLFARLARARRHFETSNYSRAPDAMLMWGGGLFVVPIVLTAVTGVPFACLSPVGWVLFMVASVQRKVEKPQPCPYCGEEADWFDDLPRIRTELVSWRPHLRTHCQRCQMSGKNFDAAFSTLRDLPTGEQEISRETARRRSVRSRPSPF